MPPPLKVLRHMHCFQLELTVGTYCARAQACRKTALLRAERTSQRRAQSNRRVRMLTACGLARRHKGRLRAGSGQRAAAFCKSERGGGGGGGGRGPPTHRGWLQPETAQVPLGS